MTIEELTSKAQLEKNNFTKGIELYTSAYDVVINQLMILSRENNGVLPNEFILSDNKYLFVTFENILKIFKLLNIKIDSISNNVPVYVRMNGNIPEAIYSDEFYKLYHIILVSK